MEKTYGKISVPGKINWMLRVSLMIQFIIDDTVYHGISHCCGLFLLAAICDVCSVYFQHGDCPHCSISLFTHVVLVQTSVRFHVDLDLYYYSLVTCLGLVFCVP